MEIVTRAQWGARYPNGAGSAPVPASEIWLHHTVTTPPPSDFTKECAAIRGIEAIGQQRFGSGISYTWLIVPSGRIFEGHSINRMGTHTGGRNSKARAICYVGNYEVLPPNDAMLNSTADLLNYGHNLGWWSRNTLNGGHRDLKSTSCPGKYAYNLIPEINRRAIEGVDELSAKAEQEIAEIHAVLFKGSQGTPHYYTVYQRLDRVEKGLNALIGVSFLGTDQTPVDKTVYQKLVQLQAAVEELKSLVSEQTSG